MGLVKKAQVGLDVLTGFFKIQVDGSNVWRDLPGGSPNGGETPTIEQVLAQTGGTLDMASGLLLANGGINTEDAPINTGSGDITIGGALVVGDGAWFGDGSGFGTAGASISTHGGTGPGTIRAKGAFGANDVVPNTPEIPANPTEQDIVDALLAIGLVTQAT